MKLNYEQLDNETLTETFRHMDFGALIRVAECSPRFRQLATKWMIDNFKLDRNQIMVDLFEKGPIYSRIGDKFKIQHYHFVLKTFRLYGYLITKLTIDGYRMNLDEITEIALHIRRYSLESLIDLNLHGAADLLINFENSFSNVVNLRIDEIYLENSLQLDVLFPQMKRFDFKVDNPSNMSTIVHHYPHLQHISINEIDWHREFKFIDKLVQLNPQIRSFASDNLLSTESVELLSTNWPHLEWLSLTDHPFDLPFYEPGFIVQLPSVKHFTLTINRRMEPIFEPFPLSFSCLENLDLKSYRISDDLSDFIVGNKHLMRISLPWTEPHRAVKLFQSLDSLNELQEIEFKIPTKSKANELIELMTAMNKLNRITVILGEHSDVDYFASDIPDDWKVSRNVTRFLEQQNLITFEKLQHIKTSKAASISLLPVVFVSSLVLSMNLCKY